MSLDELMNLTAEPSSAPTETIRRPPAPQASPMRPPTPAPAPLNPVAPRPASAAPARPAHRAPAAQPRVAVTSYLESFIDQGREWFGTTHQWLRRSDNGLIAATAVIALLLLVVVAAL
jgi:hypothetical protein